MIFDYMNETKRSNLPDSEFGIPEERKFPLDSEEHVRSAIKLFGHADESKKKQLANKISSKAKQYGIEIPETTQVYKYLKEDVEEIDYNNLEIPDIRDIVDKRTISQILDDTDPKHVYLTSDWHIFKNRYKKEVNYVNTSDIISWCKKNIKDDDVFMYLGDMSYRWINDEDKEEVKKIFKSLPGIKILIIGNHDEFSDGGDYQEYGFRYAMPELKWQNYIFTHKPIAMEDKPGYKNIHGHMHKWREYNTTDGKANVNVYPSYFNNKPVTLDYVINNFDKLTKGNKRSNWNGMGESTNYGVLQNITVEDYNLIMEARDMIDKLLNKKSNVNEWSMAACNPVVGITKPYILKAYNDSDSLIKSTVYALSPDIISDKYLVVNENCKLSIVDSSFFDNYIIEKVYKFIGNPLRVAYIAESYYNEEQVSLNYIYETLSGKESLCDDQIDFDESFTEVSLIEANAKIDSVIATMQEQWDQINNKSFSIPVLEHNKSYGDNISIMEDANGYYALNNITNNRTKSVPDIDNIAEDIIKTIL